MTVVTLRLSNLLAFAILRVLFSHGFVAHSSETNEVCFGKTLTFTPPQTAGKNTFVSTCFNPWQPPTKSVVLLPVLQRIIPESMDKHELTLWVQERTSQC